MKFGIWVIHLNGWENERWFLAPEFHPEKKGAETLRKKLQENDTRYAYEVREHDKEDQK